MTNPHEPAGYVIVDTPSREAIWGYGPTEEQAWEMLDEERPDWELDDFDAFKATAELLDLVASSGGNVSFRIRGGIAMTWDD